MIELYWYSLLRAGLLVAFDMEFCVFLDPEKHIKVDSHFAGDRLVGEQEVELELENVADFLMVSTGSRYRS